MAVGGSKCTIIHLEAASCRNQRLGSHMGLDKCTLFNLARICRASRYEKALAPSRELGEPKPNGPLAVDELRPHGHDIPDPNQDRARNSILGFPTEPMDLYNIFLIRASPSFRYAIRLINASSSSLRWLFFVAFREHVWPVSHQSFLIGMAAANDPRTASRPSGRRSLLNLPILPCVSIARLWGVPPRAIRPPSGYLWAYMVRWLVGVWFLSKKRCGSPPVVNPRTRLQAEESGPQAAKSGLCASETPASGHPPT